MTKEKVENYKRAYVELLEILKNISDEQKEKLPSNLIEKLEEQKDEEYSFEYDFSKTLSEQEIMPETKALVVQIYSNYLASDDEKEFWSQYKALCEEKIENEKRNKYSPENLFIKNNISNTTKDSVLLPTVIKKENIFVRFFKFIRSVFGNN